MLGPLGPARSRMTEALDYAPSNNFCADIAKTEAQVHSWCLTCGQQGLPPANYWNVFESMSGCNSTLSTLLANILIGFNDCEHFAQSKVICTSCRKLIEFAEELKSQLQHIYEKIQGMYSSTKLQKQAWKGFNKNKIDTIDSMEQRNNCTTEKHSNGNSDVNTIITKKIDLVVSKDVALTAKPTPPIASTMFEFDESISENKRKRCLVLDDGSSNKTKVLTVDRRNSSEENDNPNEIYDSKPKKVKFSPKKSPCLPSNLQDTTKCSFQDARVESAEAVFKLDQNVTSNLIDLCTKKDIFSKCSTNKTTEINIKHEGHKSLSNRSNKKLLDSDYELYASKKCKTNQIGQGKQVEQSFDESHVETVCNGMKNMFTTKNLICLAAQKESILYCDICEDEFDNSEQLRDHIELHYSPFY
ncbi:hypothetical protein B566_EDAN009738 [Ephemera danica]|nr:hypothetical protein B566_EDAN009738 [Ephemera danica]